MANKLKTYEPPKRKGPETIYPWDKWLDGKTTWRLVKGTDFQCSLPGMVDLIRKTATKKKLKVSIYQEQDHGDEGAVVVVPKGKKS